MAQTNTKIEATPADYRWENRIMILIANQESDSLVKTQLTAFESREKGMEDRDLITFYVFRKGDSRLNDTPLHPSSAEKILEKYGSGEPGFRFLLIGKDGGVKLRKETPVTAEEIFGLIDSMPMRQREMRTKSDG